MLEGERNPVPNPIPSKENIENIFLFVDSGFNQMMSFSVLDNVITFPSNTTFKNLNLVLVNCDIGLSDRAKAKELNGYYWK